MPGVLQVLVIEHVASAVQKIEQGLVGGPRPGRHRRKVLGAGLSCTGTICPIEAPHTPHRPRMATTSPTGTSVGVATHCSVPQSSQLKSAARTTQPHAITEPSGRGWC